VLFGGYGSSSYLADTWEWDGAAWTQRASAGPPGRVQHAMAFDSQRGVTVLFGGRQGGYPTPDFGDTWEWNGSAWTQRSGGGPPSRDWHTLVFDSQRGVSVLFGGEDNRQNPYSDTWEWNGTTWTQRPTADPTPDPLPRYGHALAYDAQQGAAVLFGGYTGSSYLSDTWHWSGTSWTLRAPTGPPARAYTAACYDSARSVVVLFGGASASDTFSDTWEWNGASWTLRTATGPPARSKHAMVFDSQRSVTVLFGGYNGSALGDTWEWNGTSWTQRQVTGPPARYYHAMAYDAHRGVAVLYGGRTSTSTYNSDTWEWDGSTWTQRVASGPDARYGASLAYDPAFARTVLFGGASSTSIGTGRYLLDPWVWDGTTWSPRQNSRIAGRYLSAMAFDSARGVIVNFGGVTGNIDGLPPSNFTFTFGDTVETRLVPCESVPIQSQPLSQTVCASGTPSFSITSAPASPPAWYLWQVKSTTGVWDSVQADPFPLPCGATATATPLNSPTVSLHIQPCSGFPGQAQHFQVRCMIIGAGGCDSVTSAEATYTSCPADFNCSGGPPTVQDLFDFLAAWFANAPAADFNASGAVSVQDLFDFLAAWFTGC